MFNSFPQAAKLANYAKYQKLCDGLFVAFSLIFFLTRLVVFPFWYEEISADASAGAFLAPLKLSPSPFRVAGLFIPLCSTAGRSLGRTGPGGCSTGCCWCYRHFTSFGSTSLLELLSKPYSRERLVSRFGATKRTYLATPILAVRLFSSQNGSHIKY